MVLKCGTSAPPPPFKKYTITKTIYEIDFRVNCVSLRETDNSDNGILFAGASCGHIALWQIHEAGGHHKPLGKFPCHDSSVTSLSVVEQDGHIILASTANDSRYAFFSRENTAVSLKLEVDFK